jgi:membrane-associated protease RseP (regulator of RpoE activity)
LRIATTARFGCRRTQELEASRACTHDRHRCPTWPPVATISLLASEQSFAQSTSLALQVLALISLSLGIVNLFPFLPLDGGHVFWALAEKISRRRIPFEVMERASVIGFVLILIIFVIGLSNDISTLTGGGFNVR